jgi:hypothetical protein
VSRAVKASSEVFADQHPQALEVEDPGFRTNLFEELSSAVEYYGTAFASGNDWLDERIHETSGERFLREEFVPLVTWCLASRPDQRPRNCHELLTALLNFGIPAVGHIVDLRGEPMNNSLFAPS